jgi:hypothetical protein
MTALPLPHAQRPPRILLVGLLPGMGGMHLPRHLSRVGLDVFFIGIRACLASSSSHIKMFYPWQSDGGGLAMMPFIDCLRQSQPEWIIPIDELSTQVLQHIGTGQIEGSTTPLQTDITELVRRSLGNPRHYPLLAVRRRACETARAAGIPMADQTNADTLQACLEFARRHGYPVVLKQEASMGGIAAFILDNATALSEFAASGKLTQTGLPWIIQKFIPGILGMHTVFAEQGRVLAQLSAIQLRRRSDRPTAPSSVIKLLPHDGMAASCAAFTAAAGLSGFHGWDFQLDATGNATMIEHNPRPISISHLGHLSGNDLCRALAAVCGATTIPLEPPNGNEYDVALFPDEWQRDPLSPMLHAAFHDAPWDDQALLTTLLQENIRFIQ